MAVTQERKTFDALRRIYQTDPSVLISNGFLTRVTDEPELLGELNSEEQSFLKLSVDTFEHETMLAVDAANEGNKALIEAEQKAIELEKANEEAEVQKKIAKDLQARAEKDRDAIAAELESTAQYQMQSDRQRRQFIIAEAHAYPAWGILFVFIIGIFFLLWNDKQGVDVLVPVLAGVLGALFQAYSGAFSSLFTPLVREEKKENSRSSKCQAKD